MGGVQPHPLNPTLCGTGEGDFKNVLSSLPLLFYGEASLRLCEARPGRVRFAFIHLRNPAFLSLTKLLY